MKRNTLTALRLAVLCAPALAATALAAQCKAGDPVGQFKGSATSTMAGDLKLTLNLVCQDGVYAGYLDSGAGRYVVTGGSFAAQVLKLQLVHDGDSIEVEVKGTGAEFEGNFTSLNDGGPVKLHRVGDADSVSGKSSAPAHN